MASLCILGTGYVGLVSGACFAELGHTVKCVDIDEEKVSNINKGKPPIFEPELEKLLRKNLEAGRLSATADLKEAASSSEISFICVGTPSAEDGSTDLSHLKRAASELGKALAGRKKHLVVVKSTVPPGTTESLQKVLADAGASEFGLCMNPEFLREGNAVSDFMKPDRVVIGGLKREDIEVVAGLYSNLDAPILKTDLRTAEMIKYASNAFLATKISFANELANMCERFGIDVYDVVEGMGYDARIE
ncbi:hypothetical protein DRN67_03425, partial [Candidatus Micrarchaeota archaeon]